jgi:hypothetical protein
MPDLRFEVAGVEIASYAALPTLLFKLAITNTPAHERVHSVALRCQIMIAATKRRYSAEAKARLVELFGEPERWRETLRAFVWLNTNVTVPGFTGETIGDMPIICAYDFEAAFVRYFDALEAGEIPLAFLFSGAVFYEAEAGRLQVAQISWEREAEYRLPVALWRELMARYYPNTAWIHVRKDVFDRLRHYRARHGLPSWEETLARLLDADLDASAGMCVETVDEEARL